MSKLSYEDIFEYSWQPSSLVFKDSVLPLKNLNKNTGLWWIVTKLGFKTASNLILSNNDVQKRSKQVSEITEHVKKV